MHRGKKRREGVGEEGLSALEPSRRAHTNEAEQDDAEVEGGDVDLVALEDVGPTSQMNPSHAAGLAGVSETSLDGLPPLAEKGFAGIAFEFAAVEVEGLLSTSGFSLAESSREPLPIAPPLLPPFRNAGLPAAQRCDIRDRQ